MIIDGKGNHVPDLPVDPPETDGYEGDLEDYRNEILDELNAIYDLWHNIAYGMDDMRERYPDDEVISKAAAYHWSRFNQLQTAISMWDNHSYEYLAELYRYNTTADEILGYIRDTAKKEVE